MTVNTKVPPSHADLFEKMEGRNKTASQQAQASPTVTPDASKKEENTQQRAQQPGSDTPADSNAGADQNQQQDQSNQQSTDDAAANAAPKGADELTDEEFLEQFRKRTGRKVDSIDEFKEAPKPPTAEEIRAAEEKERTEGLEWALANNVLTRDKYDTATREKSRDKRSIALDLFKAEIKEGDPKIADEDVEALFMEYYGESEDPKSWKYTRGQKAIEKVANEYLAQFSAIDTIVDQYREHKTSEANFKAYTKVVNKVAKDLPKEISFAVPYKSVDGKEETISYTVPVDDKILGGIVKAYTRPGMELSFKDMGGYSPENVANEINYHLVARMKDVIIPQLLQRHAERVEQDVVARLKNIPVSGTPLAAQDQNTSAKPKTPPSHEDVFTRMPKFN